MRRKSKGINRLSIGLGILGEIVLWIAMLALGVPFEHIGEMGWLLVILFCCGAFLVGWGIPKLIHWIYMGFKNDREGLQK